MLNYFSKKTNHRKFLGLYGFLFVIIIFSSYAGIQNHASDAEEKRLCSVKSKQSKPLIDVNEMLLSIKSFSLSDTDD